MPLHLRNHHTHGVLRHNDIIKARNCHTQANKASAFFFEVKSLIPVVTLSNHALLYNAESSSKQNTGSGTMHDHDSTTKTAFKKRTLQRTHMYMLAHWLVMQMACR
jgi:hypothetical protein